MINYIGQYIDRYRITERIGLGGMAVVYKAYDVRLERDVALKLIRTEAIPAEQHARLLKRFEHEAKSQARFSHNHILPVFDYGDIDGIPYLVMAYVPGGTLKDKTGQPMEPRQALDHVSRIADALQYAHELGIIHRDVKPSNILIDEKGRSVLADFGIAKTLEGSDVSLTGTGLGVGTPEYMAPEQWLGETSPSSDQYALGVVLYELLTGQKPFTADTPMAIALKQINDPLPRPNDLVANLPETLEKVLYKTLARHPQDRFTSLGEFNKALSAILEHWPLTPPGQLLDSSPLHEAETFDALDLTPPAITTLPENQEALPQKEIREFILPPWSLWVGVGVLILALLAVGTGVVLSSLLLVDRSSSNVPADGAPQVMITFTEKEPTPQISDTPIQTKLQTEVPADVQMAAPSPTGTHTQALPLGIGSSAVNPITGASMVYVPEGEFLMGSEDADAFENEFPSQSIYLDDYWIFQTEVTNSQFKAFVEQMGYSTTAEKKGWSWLFEGGQWNKVTGATWLNPEDLVSDINGMDDYPVVHVSWHDASDYCQWAGGRLPTEAEWEKAARGEDGARFPWGNSQPTCSLANYGECNQGSVKVGSFPAGASPNGALDMAGNVWEWVSDYYQDDYYVSMPAQNPTGPFNSEFRGLRGGSWARHSGTLRTAYRGRAYAGDSYNLYGFRCVYTGEP